MNKKIFRLNFLVSVIVLVITFTMVFGALFYYFEGQIFSELESETEYVSAAIKNEGADYIKGFSDSSRRITLIDKNGAVIADSAADAGSMGDHSDRQEIVDAQKFGSGKSSRYSATLMQKTLYYAVKLDDGSILRLSTVQNSVFAVLSGLIQPFVAILAIALIVSLVLSKRASKAIIDPINRLDLDNPEKNVAYEELTPLLRRIHEQKETISRQIEEAGRRQAEFSLIIENMQEGLLITDRHANLLMLNSSAKKLLGAKNEKSVFELNRTKEFTDAVLSALNGEKRESETEIKGRNYQLLVTPVKDGDAVAGAVALIIDDTERIQRETLRREFTSNVSHELKTPLTSILGFAEILKAGGTPDDTVKDFANSIFDEAKRLVSLVSDIIKISELDENAVKFDEEKVDLFVLCEDVRARLNPIAKKNNIKLTLTGTHAFIPGSATVLSEMIYNLADNGIKYNKDGGKVNIDVADSGEKVLLTVSDTGIGIPASEQARVFERFYRVDKSRSKEAGGTGLGLSIVKHGAQFHNAQISLESAPGSGTSVEIKFNK